MLISKGNIEWLPRGNHINKKQMTWAAFAKLIEGQGKTTKVKKAAAKKPAKAPKKTATAPSDG